MESNTRYSYDRVPYRSLPFPQSHPDRLAVMATLFGLRPPSVAQARVLELGCAAGGNIIPIAEMYPACFAGSRAMALMGIRTRH